MNSLSADEWTPPLFCLASPQVRSTVTFNGCPYRYRKHTEGSSRCNPPGMYPICGVPFRTAGQRGVHPRSADRHCYHTQNRPVCKISDRTYSRLHKKMFEYFLYQYSTTKKVYISVCCELYSVPGLLRSLLRYLDQVKLLM